MATKDNLADELSEAKRQRASIEEKFDEASESWREERRRLHSEVDTLYQFLEKARKTARPSTGGDDGKATKLQVELDKASDARVKAEEALVKGKDKWKAEREKLKASVTAVESRLVEMIERANNPTRRASTKKEAPKKEAPKKDPKETEYKARIRELEDQADARVEEARTAWKKERGQLELDLDRLKKKLATQPKPQAPPPAERPSKAPARPQKPSKGKKPSFADKLRARFDPGSGAGKSPDGAVDSEELGALQSKVDSLERERGSLDQQAEELGQALEAARKQLETLSDERNSIQEERDRLQSAAQEIETGEPELHEAQKAWGNERAGLEARIAELEQDALTGKNLKKKRKGTNDAAVAALEDQLAQAQGQVEEVRGQLSSATGDWESERNRLNRTISGLEKEGSKADSVKDGIEAEFASRLESERAELATQHQGAQDAWTSEREKLSAAIAELEADLEVAIGNSQSGGDGEQIEEAQSRADAARAAGAKAEKALSAATGKWDEERKKLQSNIEELRTTAGEQAVLKAQAAEWNIEREDLVTQIAESNTSRDELAGTVKALEKEISSALAAAQSEGETRTKDMKAQAAEWNAERKQLQAQIVEANSSRDALAGTVKALEKEISSALAAAQSEGETRTKDMKAQAAEWNAERKQLQAQIVEANSSRDALADTVKALEKEISSAGAAAKSEGESRSKDMKTQAAEWNAERKQLQAQIVEANSGRDELTDTVKALEKEKKSAAAAAKSEGESHTRDMKAQVSEWNAERKKLQAQIVEANTLREKITEELKTEQEKESAPSAKELEETIKEREEALRNSLLDRFGVEMEVLKAEQEQLRTQEMQPLQAALKKAKDSAAAAAKSGGESQETALQSQAEEWNAERDVLRAQIAEASGLKDAALEKVKALEGKAEQAPKSKSTTKAASVGSEDLETKTKEIERVNSALKSLELKIDNPATNMPAGMRATKEQADLLNYLKGLRFGRGEDAE